ncbi:LacI family DNA-binding transcriptional regulator [Microbacterium karelineae]|uniref:LacI family DNA-binding transcriptional regulator n=1 Tax=Microbacterium karelineae TaxID=2654283 RepID=UPI0012E9CC40|nr:LacI family DNA-binding transcriptional regulator [Microbacterium karelineae]
MATMREVAARAEVSIATVSFVVNGTKKVTDATRKRVEDAMRDLGFSRNPVGAALARGRTRILAMLYPAVERRLSPTAVTFFTSASRRARERGYDLVMWPIGDDTAQVSVLAGTGLIDGALLMEVRLDDPRVAALHDRRVPFALIGRTSEPDDLAYVDVDFPASVREAHARLRDLGHEDIAFLTGDGRAFSHGAVARARETYEAAATASGSPVTMLSCAEDPGAGRELGSRFRQEHPTTTALIAMNEPAVPGLLIALAHEGVRVPDDLSVISMGSTAFMAGMTDPRLTFMRTPGPELGEWGVDALIDRIETPDAPLPQRLLPCEYVAGDSVASRG